MDNIGSRLHPKLLYLSMQITLFTQSKKINLVTLFLKCNHDRRKGDSLRVVRIIIQDIQRPLAVFRFKIALIKGQTQQKIYKLQVDVIEKLKIRHIHGNSI